ncbi:MAG: ATP-binding protein [Opitutales bacterium]
MPRRLRTKYFKYRLVLGGAAILLAGSIAGGLSGERTRRDLLDAFVRDAERAAAAFDRGELDRLTATPADLTSPVYAAVKARLSRCRAADPDVRSVGLLRYQAETRRVVFLAVSEAAGAPEAAPPGAVSPQATTSASLRSVLRNGVSVADGPTDGGSGASVTGYAVVARGDSGAPRDVLSIDISARGWVRRVWSAWLETAALVWLTLGLPLAGYILLRRQREQLEVIRNLSEAIEQSHTAVMIIDLEQRIEYANQGFCGQTGQVRRELIGRHWREFLTESMPATIAADLSTATRAGRNWTGEWLNRRKDGTTYPARGIVTAVRNRQDRISCHVAIYEDVTEVRKNETILRDAKERAEAGDRAKSHFLATMSHEVRTPLNGIVGFTNLLLETPLTPEQREYMQTIRSSGEALIQLTNDILDFARIESGKLKLEIQPCDPRECIEDALDLMAAKASEKKIELLHWVENDVPAIVQADGGRLRQVLINLVNNAVKFTEIGEVSVTLSASRPAGAEPGRADDWELTFVVRDTGIGIAAGQQEKLFRPFSQLDEASTRRFGGTGLGLAISSNLAGLMGGAISLQSEVGVGSTFTFTVKAPAVPAEAEPARMAPPNISGVRLVVAGQPGALRKELSRLGERWGALVAVATPDELLSLSWDLALVDVDEAMAAQLAQLSEARPGYQRERMLALVPLTLSSAGRSGLRPHFRLLINKPVHHESLRAVLASQGSATATAMPFASANSFDLRVLLVEDNPVNQRLMQKVLARLGCRWTVAENGSIALDELSRGKYDVVLMDLHMPEMDGLTAIVKIREGKAGEAMRKVWITALTADARADQRDRVMAAGADDYLIKPVRLEDLEKTLRRYLASRDPAGPGLRPGAGRQFACGRAGRIHDGRSGS